MANAIKKLVTIKLHQGSAPYKPIAKHAIADNKIETGILKVLFFIMNQFYALLN
jgi:hypothetical protein